MKIGNLLSTGITLFSLVVLLSSLSNVISKIGEQTNLSNEGFNRSKLSSGDINRVMTLLNGTTYLKNITVKIVKVGQVIQLRKGKISKMTCNEDSFLVYNWGESKEKCRKCNCNGPQIRNVSCSSGWCYCEPGYTGDKCQEKCKFGSYGEQCYEKCQCEYMGTESCDHISGKCNCKDGYHGQECEIAPCICNGPNSVNGSCDSKGYCFCKPGFNGPRCDDMCDDGKYGQDCKNNIRCVRGYTKSYNHINGKCICKTGWMGQICNRFNICVAGEHRPLVNEEFSENCQKCNCVEANTDGLCDPFGKCNCKHGYEGNTCDKKCSGDFFGKYCKTPCGCISNNTESCHHLTGVCECKVGFDGGQCEESLESLQV